MREVEIEVLEPESMKETFRIRIGHYMAKFREELAKSYDSTHPEPKVDFTENKEWDGLVPTEPDQDSTSVDQ